MDQLEFENYISKIKHRCQEGDYKTAAYIADKIEWESVQDVNLLVYASGIYEKIKDYDSAKALLEYAYSVAPVKNRLYYALCNLNIKTRDFREAGHYYYDFCQNFPNDSRKYVLQYYYLSARHADLDQRIRVLEKYIDDEKDEEMMYELALLYEKVDDIKKMLEICDFIVDFFGVKRNGFGKDALLLKKSHTVLNDTEEGLLLDYQYNKEEGNFENGNYDLGVNDRLTSIDKKNDDDNNQDENNKEEHRILKEDEIKPPVILQVKRKDDNIDNEIDDEIDKEIDNRNNLNFDFEPEIDSYDKAELENVFLNDEEQKEKLKKMIQSFKEEEEQNISSQAFAKFKKDSFSLKERFTNMKIEDIKLHMIIEAHSKEEGFNIAKSELDYIHNVLNEKVKSAKVSAYNINDNGLRYYLQKLGNRDLIIENGGRLKDQAIDEIEEFIINKNHKNIIALVDVVNNFDKMANDRPSFINRFDIYSVYSEKKQETLEVSDKIKNNDISTISKEENVRKKEIINDNAKQEIKQELRYNEQEKINKENTKNEYKDDKIRVASKFSTDNTLPYQHPTRDDKDTQMKIATNDELMRDAIEAKKSKMPQTEQKHHTIMSSNEMSVDEFVEFCKAYCKSIDCVMQGKTIPALYERAEELLEDGIKLTEKNAIKLIEDAADRAEKPKLFNRPKYDKEGCLILTEDHFI